MNTNQSAILKELDSDDELPDEYTDATILPAYQFENRFDDINFYWIHNSNQFDADTKPKENSETYDLNSDNNNLYMRGVLKYQDLYCLKAVEPFTCSNTLIWLVNFLLHKDLQSHYKYLKSCLVKDHVISPNPLMNKNYKPNVESVQSNRFEIVLKN